MTLMYYYVEENVHQCVTEVAGKFGISSLSKSRILDSQGHTVRVKLIPKCRSIYSDKPVQQHD